MSEAMKPGTPLPWFADPDTRPGMEWNWHICSGPDNRVCFMSNGPDSETNAAYIVHACNNYPATAREVEELRAEVERLREALDLADTAFRGADVDPIMLQQKIDAALASKGEEQ